MYPCIVCKIIIEKTKKIIILHVAMLHYTACIPGLMELESPSDIGFKTNDKLKLIKTELQ